MAVNIMHRVSVKLCPALGWMFSPCWKRPVIAVSIVEMMVYMPVKVLWAVKPRSRADENTARKPLRSVVTVRRAVIRRSLIIAIRTNRRLSDTDCNLCIRFSRGSEQTSRSHRY